MENIEIILSDKTLIEQNCLDFVKTDDSGGIVFFVGTVRNLTKGKRVLRLDFEAYEPMAIAEMRKIEAQTSVFNTLEQNLQKFEARWGTPSRLRRTPPAQVGRGRKE